MLRRSFRQLAAVSLLGLSGCSFVVPLHNVPPQAPSTGDFARIEADKAAAAPPAFFDRGRVIRGNEEAQYEGMLRTPEMALGRAASLAATGGPGTIVVGVVTDKGRLDLEQARIGYRLGKPAGSQSGNPDAGLAKMLAGVNPESEGYRYTCSYDKDPEAAQDLLNGAQGGSETVYRLCAWRGGYDPKKNVWVKPRDAAPYAAY